MSFAATLSPSWVTAGPWRQFGDWYLPPQSFSPNMLRPYAWYDAHLGGSAAGITDSSPNARAAMTVGAGSNSPLWLPYVRPSVLLPPSTSNIITVPGQTHDLSVQTDQSYRFRVKINALGTSADTFYGVLVTDTNGVLPYVTAGGALLFATYSPGYNGSGSLGDITPYLGQWVDLWFKYQHGAPAAVTGYVRTDMTKALADNTGWTQLGASTVTPVPALNPAASYMYSTCPANGGEVLVNEIAGWKSATPSGSPTINWKAEGCTQTSYVDTINGHTWLINRPASGRKLVAQSAAARSARSMFLLAVDDWLDVPAAALPSLAADSTHVIIGRVWATPANYQSWWGRKLPSGAAQGIVVRNVGTTSQIETIWRSTAPAEYQAQTGLLTLGARQVLASTRSGNSATTYANNTAGTPVTVSGTIANAGGAQIGRDQAAGALYADMEFEAFLTFDRALTAGEIAQLVSYYGGGL